MFTQEEIPQLSDMIIRIKTDYLDNRNVSIRRFSQMTGIRRPRLNKLFLGKATATDIEISAIDIAINQIEADHQIAKSLKTQDLKPNI